MCSICTKYLAESTTKPSKRFTTVAHKKPDNMRQTSCETLILCFVVFFCARNFHFFRSITSHEITA